MALNATLEIILPHCAMLRCYIVLTHIESQRGKLRHFYVCCLPSQLKISLLDFLGFLLIVLIDLGLEIYCKRNKQDYFFFQVLQLLSGAK